MTKGDHERSEHGKPATRRAALRAMLGGVMAMTIASSEGAASRPGDRQWTQEELRRWWTIPEGRIPAAELLRRLQAVGTHGDLRDVPFLERTLELRIGPNPAYPVEVFGREEGGLAGTTGFYELDGLRPDGTTQDIGGRRRISLSLGFRGGGPCASFAAVAAAFGPFEALPPPIDSDRPPPEFRANTPYRIRYHFGPPGPEQMEAYFEFAFTDCLRGVDFYQSMPPPWPREGSLP
jgi:hypothetical protein